MTARKMFEALGFKLYGEEYQAYFEIEYRREMGCNHEAIAFDTEKKMVWTPDTYYVDLPLYQAITKQIEELGWLNQ